MLQQREDPSLVAGLANSQAPANIGIFLVAQSLTVQHLDLGVFPRSRGRRFRGQRSDSETTSRAVVLHTLKPLLQALCLDFPLSGHPPLLPYKQKSRYIGSSKFVAKNTTFPSQPCLVKVSDSQCQVPWRCPGKFCLPNINAAPGPPFLPSL